MTVLRRKTEEDYTDRKAEASKTVALLDDVLQKGADLQHAANCVLISTDLHTQREALGTQITDAPRTATTYETTTNTLLNVPKTIFLATTTKISNGVPMTQH